MPEPKRVIHIHAGLPKTGSSAIQRFLLQNRAALAAQGLLVPEAGLGERGDHHDWMFDFGGISPLARRRVIGDLVADLERQPQDQILISTEFAYLMMRFGFARHGYRALRARGFALKFHLFLRPQVDFAVSSHAEFLRNLLVDQPFPAFVETNFLPFARDYGEIVRRLERVSGEPVAILPYTRGARERGVWWDLLESTGWSGTGEGLEQPGEVNPSLGPIGVAALTTALRRIDRRAMMQRWGLRRAVRLTVLRVTGNFPPEQQRYNPMSLKMRDALWESCRSLNDPLAEQSWGQSWDDVFAAEKAARPRRVVYARRRDHADSEAAQLHDRLSQRLFRRIKEKTRDVAAKRAEEFQWVRTFGTPVDWLADRAMRRIVRGW